MRHASLFSGIGGFDLAAQWMGWENVFQVEIDGFCQKVLEKNFPGVARYGDIKQFDGTKYRGAVDILTGGFPCQSFSVNGKGALDLSLWREMLRVVGEIKPRIVVAENVFGILVRKKGMALSTVYNDLENEGYQTMPAVVIPACAEGAPHRRDRVWIVAYTESERFGEKGSGNSRQKEWITRHGCEWIAPNSKSSGFKQGGICIRNETDISKLDNNFRTHNWDSFPTQSPICRRDDGIPNRVDRIKSLGNAIVPQVAFEIFKAIESVNQERV